MPTNDVVDPAAEAEQRADRAKASLLSRVEQLKHKLSDAKEKVDLPAQISKHALPAVGIAFALGVAAALRRSGSPSDGAGAHMVRGAVWSTITAFGLRALREVALGQLGRVAKQWWDEQGDAALASGPAPSPTSGDPSAEH